MEILLRRFDVNRTSFESRIESTDSDIVRDNVDSRLLKTNEISPEISDSHETVSNTQNINVLAKAALAIASSAPGNSFKMDSEQHIKFSKKTLSELMADQNRLPPNTNAVSTSRKDFVSFRDRLKHNMS